jgi:endonuclease III
MTKNKSGRIISLLKEYYGIPTPDLLFSNLYQLTAAVILSAQTTDRQVNSVTGSLFKKYPDFKTLAGARLRDVESIIKSTGFYHNKARHVIDTAKAVMKSYGGMLPDGYEDLIRLPGIGRKSANVILSIGFGRQALAVDTHIIRIANRLGYVNSKDPLKVEKALTSFIPEEMWKTTHLLLIRHGRVLCPARNPLCGECPVTSLCGFSNNNP